MPKQDKKQSSDAKELKGGRGHSRPGPLRGAVSLRVHTIQAAQLIMGRRRSENKSGIPGLFAFAKALDDVTFGPNADSFSPPVRAALEHAEQVLRNEEMVSLQIIETLEGITIHPAQSSTPQVFDLRLRSSDAFHAAMLIGRFDRLVATLMTLSHVGALERGDLMRRIHVVMKRLRTPFSLACQQNAHRMDVRLRMPHPMRLRESTVISSSRKLIQRDIVSTKFVS